MGRQITATISSQTCDSIYRNVNTLKFFEHSNVNNFPIDSNVCGFEVVNLQRVYQSIIDVLTIEIMANANILMKLELFRLKFKKYLHIY